VLKTGAWFLAERGNLHVVAEVYPHAAYAYLWERSKGIRSHVWLFNCAATVAEDDTFTDEDEVPPEMAAENIDEGIYLVPDSIDDISCIYNIADSGWDFYWAGRKMAALSEATNPGSSAFVRKGNGLASVM
jgi:hypothetical protein